MEFPWLSPKKFRELSLKFTKKLIFQRLQFRWHSSLEPFVWGGFECTRPTQKYVVEGRDMAGGLLAGEQTGENTQKADELSRWTGNLLLDIGCWMILVVGYCWQFNPMSERRSIYIYSISCGKSWGKW